MGRCKCGSSETIEVKTAGGSPHYAAEVCADCRRHVRWIAKPAGERIRRPAGHRGLVQKHSRGFCELCLTKQENLPAGQTLEGHHVLEYHHGGGGDRQNVWIVCTGCAKLIHWVRTWRAN